MLLFRRTWGNAAEFAPIPRWLPTLGLCRNADCVFVLSCGRSGTETLTHVLGASPAIWALHEPHPQLMSERKRARIQIGAMPDEFRRIFVDARRHSLLAARMHSRIYAETSARLTFFAPVIRDLLPRAKFIFLHRHPGDIVRSGMRRGWYVDHPADAQRIEPVAGEAAFEQWEHWDAFRKISWYWDAYHRFILEFLNDLSADRWIELRSSELFDRESDAVQRIFGLLNVPPPNDPVIAQVLESRHNAQAIGEFPQFALWTNEQKSILKSLAGETASALGYDLD